MLRRITERNEDGSVIDDGEVMDPNLLAAEVAQQGEGGAPQFPELGKSRSYSHGQLVTPEFGARGGEEFVVKFQENGLVEGVGKVRFRFVFGGILMGYFVSSIHAIQYVPFTGMAWSRDIYIG